MFLSPLILPLLALAAVPIIIHLLNRRRFQRVDWAPMKYLKLTIKTNRRRLRLEQLLLLALRTALILVMILAVARPVISGGGVASWLAGRTRTSRILVIDDSLSMGYVTDNRSAMERARQVAGEMVRRVDVRDSITALATSSPDSPLVREAHLADPGMLISEIAKLDVTETTSNWPATLRTVDEYLAGATFPERQIIVITDLRKTGWSAGVTALTQKWAGQSVSVRVIDVGSRQTANAAVVALEQNTPIALPGGEVKCTATIRNDGVSNITGAQAILKVGDDSRPLVLPDLPPGVVTSVPLSVTSTKPGQLMVQLSIPNDALPQDNTRFLSIDVRGEINQQLVDGEPSAQAFESATDFLALSFSIGSEPWRVQRSSDADWAGIRPMARPDVLTLADVASISPENTADIEQRVRDGMGLMIFCGEQVDTAAYNLRLFREGAGLMPARLERPVDEPVTGLVVEALEQSPLSALSTLAPAAMARVSARRFMSVTIPNGQSQATRILARWNDSEGHPAVIEKRLGKGRVILWTMTANKQWGDWPLDSTYVLAVRSAALAIARPEAAVSNALAGQPLRWPLETGEFATDAKVLSPGRDAAEPAAVIQPEAAQGGSVVLGFAHTPHAGRYLMTWKSAAGLEQSHAFAVNGDPSESDLTPISDGELQSLFGPVRAEIVHYSSKESGLDGQGRELWRMLAFCALGMLMVESVFAVWVGRER